MLTLAEGIRRFKDGPGEATEGAGEGKRQVETAGSGTGAGETDSEGRFYYQCDPAKGYLGSEGFVGLAVFGFWAGDGVGSRDSARAIPKRTRFREYVKVASAVHHGVRIEANRAPPIHMHVEVAGKETTIRPPKEKSSADSRYFRSL
jgi:hypothetical protein